MSRCIEILKDDLVDEDWRMGEKHWQGCSKRRGWVEEEEEERDDVERHCCSSSEERECLPEEDSGSFIPSKRRRLKCSEEKAATYDY